MMNTPPAAGAALMTEPPQRVADSGRVAALVPRQFVELLLPGEFVEPGAARGYHIDLRPKAFSTAWPPPWPFTTVLHVPYTQWGLGCYEHYLAGDGEEWLQASVRAAEHLLDTQEREGAYRGGFIHTKPYPHTFRLEPPWLSGIAQGQAASLFVRLAGELGQERFVEAARDALRPLAIPSPQGGVLAQLGGGPFPEEYPTDPPSYVLNGGLFALFGVYDAEVALGDSGLPFTFADLVETFASSIDRWDTGYWSRYDLFPHPAKNVASSAYHRLHVSQLTALGRLVQRDELEGARVRFERYGRSKVGRRRAFLGKALFRMLVSRRHPPSR